MSYRIVRAVEERDLPTIQEIYNYYINQTVITLDEEPLSLAYFKTKFLTLQAKGHPFLVLESNGAILGFAYAAEWKDKSGFNMTLESTIYLSNQAPKGQGLGAFLLESLLGALQEKGIKNLIAAVTLPNNASVALHEKFGFQKVAEFRDIAAKFGQFCTVGYWQLSLD